MGSIMFGILNSCQKSIDSETLPISTPENKVRVEESYLVFENFEDFTTFRTKAYSLSPQQRIEIENKLNFVSLQTLYENLVKEVEQQETISDINSVVEQYKDVFIYTDDGLKYKRENQFSSHFINREGFFKIGQVYYRAIDEGRIIASAKSKEELDAISDVQSYLTSENTTIAIDRFQTKSDFVIYRNSILTDDAGPTVQGTNNHYLISVRNESNNRRLYVDMVKRNGYYPIFKDGVYTGFYFQTMLTLDFTHRKKGTFGIWNLYTSPTYIAELKFKEYYNYPNNPPIYSNWISLFSGTLDDNSSDQTFIKAPHFGTLYSFTYPTVAYWTEPMWLSPTSVTCTGNGQSWYTNTYLQ